MRAIDVMTPAVVVAAPEMTVLQAATRRPRLAESPIDDSVSVINYALSSAANRPCSGSADSSSMHCTCQCP